MILKAAANEGNARAAFAYCVFLIAGICMEEPNMEEYEIYIKKSTIL